MRVASKILPILLIVPVPQPVTIFDHYRTFPQGGPLFRLAAQTSAGFKVEEHVFNAGGHATNSPSFRITMDAIGESATGSAINSTAFRMEGGLVAAYTPPGEVPGLGFSDHETLTRISGPARPIPTRR